ncbi:MAG: PD-(D/E)XK nuclease family transposase [Leptospiraceae bacterium]|nr:PD-(D/E)XK nuclease family transposase [Leptospiraceae bacterium]MBK9501698.1 PD-(D/E)XK nuclease family transposase [Leptospiraceae bacterium]MBP9162224.1 PD-(D/E)XK nuclease family transposase [Leptospiraceae bacterium]
MKLLPLTNDFTFKAVFSKHEDVLLDLLNSFPDFEGDNQISSLKVLNPRIEKEVNFPLFKDREKFYWHFQIRDEEEREKCLTEDFSVRIIEIPKFAKDISRLESPLDFWVYLLKEVTNLKGEQMKTLKRKNPKIKKAVVRT